MGRCVCVLNACLYGDCYYGLVSLFVLWLLHYFLFFSFAALIMSAAAQLVLPVCCITIQEYCSITIGVLLYQFPGPSALSLANLGLLDFYVPPVSSLFIFVSN